LKKKMINKNAFMLLLATAALIALAVLVIFAFRKPYTFHGTVINPPLPVTDFSLLTANSESVRLSEQEGKIVLLFFGYTSCPDVCPLTLATFQEVHQRLGDDAQKVRFAMITADPERDMPDKVAAYAARFHPGFIGLSGDRAELEKIWKQLGVFVEKQESNSAAGYLVSHTTSVYVLDQNGSVIMTFPYGTSAVDMTDDIRQLLKQSKQEQTQS
jgi:protein SCO1/2